MISTFKNKKILVTGGAGFIGSHLVNRLFLSGAKVSVTVKYNSMIDNIRLKHLWNKIEIIESDLRNLDSILSFNKKKFDIIFHLAAYNHVGDSFGKFSESISSNFISTCNLIEYGPEFKKFIYMSTSEVYGNQDIIPFNELSNPKPLSPYAIAKYSGELYTQMFKNIKNNNKRIFNICRAFNTFGPFQSEKAVIPEMIIKMLNNDKVLSTNGNQTREFNYVDNIIDGLIKMSSMNKNLSFPVNLGSGKDIKIKDLILKIEKITETKSKIKIGGLQERPTEIYTMKANNKLALKYLSWKPLIKFEDGLKKTVEWYKNNIGLFSN